MIAQQLQKLIGDAMKARDSVRLSTLRMLSSAFNYEKIDKKHDLTDEEEMSVIRKQVKQRRDSIEAYKKAGSEDRASAEEAEVAILLEFLPPEMTAEELQKIVDEAISATGANSMTDMGKVMGLVKNKAPTAEGGKVAELVRAKLG